MYVIARCNNRRFLAALCFLVLFVVQIAISKPDGATPAVNRSDDNSDDAKKRDFSTNRTITGTAEAICDTEECINQQLQSRLNTIESAFRMLLLSISSQTNDVFTPIKEMLAQDPSVKSILSDTPNILNSTSFSSNESNSNPSFEDAQVTKDNDSLQENTGIKNLKGAVKCSLADFVDIDTIDTHPSLNQSSKIVTSLNNESLEITWPVHSTECLKFSSGVWIRVYQSGDEFKLPVETSLYIPKKCLDNKSMTLHSFTLSPPSSSPTVNNDTCLFSLTRNLIQCRAYVVEVIPNYQSLRGKTLRTEIVIPPKENNESSMKSIISVVAHSNSLMLNWEDNSGCAPQLTSFNLKIFQDGIVNEEEKNNKTVTIPRSCLKRSTNEENLFSLVLPDNKVTCPIEWKPLDKCRKYKLDMSFQYSATWNGPSSSWEIFTGQEAVVSLTTDTSNSVWKCPKQHYWCRNYNGCNHINNYICDGGDNCGGIDEKYCDQTLCNNNNGFKCGRQCVPKELVCDGKYDCLDGSDEVNCDLSNVKCEQLTNPLGQFSSEILTAATVEIHSDRIFDVVGKTIFLISVQPNNQIWLTFDEFTTVKDKDFLRVYNGPYSTSPLLLSHSGSTKPPSVRSSSNELFVEFPSYYDQKYGIEAYYTSIVGMTDPFVPGCGGYIYGDGIISSPNYFSSAGISDCFWFIETRQSEDTVLLRRDNLNSPILTSALSKTDQPPLIVYDGWSTDGLVLYDENSITTQDEAVIYSVSNKILVRFKPPKVKENHVSYWHVSKISTPKCRKSYEGTSGTIKSPSYPMPYPNLTDCRWTITVKPGSKVRLLFAFFETQEGADLISVYDGSTVHSKLLLTKSGSVPTPFVINSSTNQVLIRFTSDGDTSLPGFLAVYSSV